VWLSLSARSVTDKVLAVTFPVSAFVAAGFEHSIANMYFIPAGLLLRAWAPDTFWAATGTRPGDYATVTWPDFLVGNLLPVTIGNIVGGAVHHGVGVGLDQSGDGLLAAGGEFAAPGLDDHVGGVRQTAVAAAARARVRGHEPLQPFGSDCTSVGTRWSTCSGRVP
jgi:hypothetical protein